MPEGCDAVLHPLSREDGGSPPPEPSRDASRTSLKIKSIFFFLAEGEPSGSSLALLGLSFLRRAEGRFQEFKSLWKPGSDPDFLKSGIYLLI